MCDGSPEKKLTPVLFNCCRYMCAVLLKGYQFTALSDVKEQVILSTVLFTC